MCRVPRFPTDARQPGVRRVWRVRQCHLPIVHWERSSVPAELGVRSAAVGARLGPFASSGPAPVTLADGNGPGHRQSDFRLPALDIDPCCRCAMSMATVALTVRRGSWPARG